MNGPPLHDPPFDDHDDHHKDFSPIDRIGTHQDGTYPETTEARTMDTVSDQ